MRRIWCALTRRHGWKMRFHPYEETFGTGLNGDLMCGRCGRCVSQPTLAQRLAPYGYGPS